jgi:hypothetical protein
MASIVRVVSRREGGLHIMSRDFSLWVILNPLALAKPLPWQKPLPQEKLTLIIVSIDFLVTTLAWWNSLLTQKSQIITLDTIMLIFVDRQNAACDSRSRTCSTTLFK